MRDTVASSTGSDAARPNGPAHPEADPQLEQIGLRLQELDPAPERLRTLEERLIALRADATEVAGELEVQTMEWHRERQDAITHLRAYRDRARELKVRIDALESAGRDAPCPTCGRELHEHLDRVRQALQDEWDSVVQDGKWWRRRADQLERLPDSLREIESRSIRMHADVEALAEQVEVARSALREREDLRALRAALLRRRGAGPVAS